MTTHLFLVSVLTSKDVDGLADKIANRIYTIDGVEDAACKDRLDRIDVVAAAPKAEMQVEMVDDWRPTFVERLGRAIDGFVEGWRGY